MTTTNNIKPAFEGHNYKVFIDDNDFVDVTVWGKWTFLEAEELEQHLLAGLNYLSDLGKPRLVLYDMTNLNVLTYAGPKTMGRLVQMFTNLKYNALADYGVSSIQLQVRKLISHISKEVANAGAFKDREEAVAYLNRYKQKSVENSQ